MKRFLLPSLILAATTLVSNAANPYLPLWEYIPDGEPYVLEDPDNPGKYRVYIYGSHDIEEVEYCGRDLVVWSAPVEVPTQWRYDGVIFSINRDANGELLDPSGKSDILYAPDIAITQDKKGKKTYYLYPNDQAWGRNSLIAKSDRPDGPFQVCNWSEDNPSEAIGVLGFDPAVFVDDDGRVYAYWGFEYPLATELDPKTMCTVLPGTEIHKNYINSNRDEGEFRFFEASSMRKIDDKYVLIYSRRTAPGEFGLPVSNYTLAYAYSDNPMGPFTYGGTIIDGRGRQRLPDGSTIVTAVVNGNTHGSIAQLGEQWYVFYHRQTGLDEFSRQAMVAPIEVKVEKGKGGKVYISEAEFTSEGFELGGLNPYTTYPVAVACHFTAFAPEQDGWPYKQHMGPYVKPGRYYGNPANAPKDIDFHINPVVNNTHGSIVGIKYYNMDLLEPNSQLLLELVPKGVDGTIIIKAGDIYSDKPDKTVELGRITLKASDPQVVTFKDMDLTEVLSSDKVKALKGRQPIYMKMEAKNPRNIGESLCDLYTIRFVK